MLILATCFANNTVSAQEEQNGETMYDRSLAVKIFIDCNRCDIDYLRREIPYVNFVRDRHEADVHVLMTQQTTGSGGREYQINLIGKGGFEGVDNKISYVSTPDETSDLTRQGYTRMMGIGLMQYVGQTPLAHQIDIRYGLNGKRINAADQLVEDKWKSWVFDLDLSGRFDGEASYTSLQLENDLSVEKITPDWKIEFAAGYDERLGLYQLEDTLIRSNRTSASFRHLLVKSIGDHWSVGGRASVSSSSYSNNRFSWSVYPAIEYNYFPYKESSRKQLRIQYRVGYGYTYYRDTTIYNKIEEGLFGQQLAIAVEFRQPWGSVSSSLQGSTFLPDISKYSIRMWSGVYLRILKGLSLSIRGDAAYIQDQLSLPKADATPEEILLKQRQLATQFDYSINIGFSYTFGSIYNNVVNPRFGYGSSGY